MEISDVRPGMMPDAPLRAPALPAITSIAQRETACSNGVHRRITNDKPGNRAILQGNLS